MSMDEVNKADTAAAAEGSNDTQAPLGAHTTGAAAQTHTEIPPLAAAPVPVSTPEVKTSPSANIAKILQEVKLPERRDATSAGDAKPQKQIEISPLLSDTAVLNGEPMQPAIAAETRAIPKSEASPVVAMHTLRDDLKHVIHDNKISYVRAAALEQEKRKGEPEEVATPPSGRRVRGTLFAVGLFSLLGLAALGGIYVAVEQQSAPLPQQKNDSLVFAEQSATLPLNDTDVETLKSKLAQVRTSSQASLGSITRIVPVISRTESDGSATARTATLLEFMSSIDAHPPTDLVRALSETFFLGIHTVDKNAPILVIPVSSYDYAFAGMLAWEAQMNGDLSPLFMPLPVLTTGEDGIPTQRTFTDVVMRNYDVRALKDDSGNIQLYYSFPTRNILIIAESPYTFAEILTRLQAARSL